MYVEDELPRLVYGDAIRRIGVKFVTDFIILSLSDKQRLQNVSADTANRFADFFEKVFSEKFGEVSSLDFYGNDFGMKRLGYIVIPYILRNLIRQVKSQLQFEDGPYPIRQDGGYGWFVIEETADDREAASEYYVGCNTAGDDSGSKSQKLSHVYYYWLGKYFDNSVYHGYGVRRMCANNIPQDSENGFVKMKLSDEAAVQFLKNGLIHKCGSGFKLGFACFRNTVFRDFVSKFQITDPELIQSLSDWIKTIRKTFASFVPKRLDSQINQWVSFYASRLIGFVTEELISRGVLKQPDTDAAFTDGVFYVEGEYIGNI